MLANKVVCIKIGLDSYDDFFKQVLDLMVNINVNRQWSTVLCFWKSFMAIINY